MTNTERAKRAEEVLLAFSRMKKHQNDDQFEEDARDFVCDLMHALRFRGFDPTVSVKTAMEVHGEEFLEDSTVEERQAFAVAEKARIKREERELSALKQAVLKGMRK